MTERAVLVELLPWDPVAGAVAPVRATDTADSRVTALNGQAWRPALIDPGEYALDLFAPAFPGFAATPTATIRIDRAAFPNAGRYAWADRRARLWIGTAGAAWPWTLFFDGLMVAAEIRDGSIDVQLTVADAWADKPLLSSLYAGTGGAEGSANLKGLPKPLAFGAPKFVAPVLLDAAAQIYQFHAGAAQGATVALDRLSRFGSATADFGSYAALDGASIPPGRWATAKAIGMVRFGAPPEGPMTLFVEGDNAGAGGWVRKPGAIIRRIAKLVGLADANIDDTSLSALDSAVNRNLSLYLSGQVSARQAIGQVAASANAMAIIDLLGVLRVIRPSLTSPALTLAADGTSAVQVGDVELRETGAPWWRIQMEADRAWRVHGTGEIAYSAELIDRGDYAAGTVYREGNVVTQQGARWVYINPTPASGNPPPTLPTSSNAYWDLLSGPIDFTHIVGTTRPADNATRQVPRGTYSGTTTYARGDQVIEAGSTYELIVASSTGNAPPDATRWQLVAAAGSGPPGADGSDGFSAELSNPAAVVATAPDGSGGSYGAAGGVFEMLQGSSPASATFSVPAKTPSTPAWITINSAGVYTVSDPGVDLATATIRAAVGAQNFDRTYTLAKAKTGPDGQDGISRVEAAPVVVAAFANGNVKSGSLPQTRQLGLRQGTTDLTGTASWSVISQTNLTLSVSSAGVVTLSAISADSGSGTIRATLSAVNYDFPITARKIRDGAAPLMVSAELSFPTSSTITTIGTTPDLALPANIPAEVSMQASWESTGGTCEGTFRLQYSTDGGGSWITIGGDEQASAFPTEPAFVAVSRSLSSSSSARLVRFRAQASMTNAGSVANASISSLFASATA